MSTDNSAIPPPPSDPKFPSLTKGKRDLQYYKDQCNLLISANMHLEQEIRYAQDSLAALRKAAVWVVNPNGSPYPTQREATYEMEKVLRVLDLNDMGG